MAETHRELTVLSRRPDVVCHASFGPQTTIELIQVHLRVHQSTRLHLL